MKKHKLNTADVPDRQGRFGSYGGRYVPETLMPALLELEREYAKAKKDPRFQAELADYLKQYVGRPTPLYFAKRLTRRLGGATARHVSGHRLCADGPGRQLRGFDRPRALLTAKRPLFGGRMRPDPRFQAVLHQ